MWFAGVHLTNAAQTCICTAIDVICDTWHGDVDFGVLCQVPDIMSTSLTPDILTGVSFSVSDISSKTVSNGMCARWCMDRLCEYLMLAPSCRILVSGMVFLTEILRVAWMCADTLCAQAATPPVGTAWAPSLTSAPAARRTRPCFQESHPQCASVRSTRIRFALLYPCRLSTCVSHVWAARWGLSGIGT